MSKSRARYLSDLLGSTGLVKRSRSSLAGGDGTIDLDALPTIPNSQLEHSSISIAGHTLSLGGSLTLNTADIGEHASYLYYTDARTRSAISVTGAGSYNSTTGVITITGEVTSVNSQTGAVSLDTDDISEGSINFYYTDARVGSYLTANNYATQSYVSTAISNLVDTAPTTLDTLNELAAALGDDANFSTTVTNSIATKLPSSSYTAADVLTKIKTVDGAGSELDADLLDGYNLSGATSVATKIFNNKGQNHVTYTDFNTVMTPGPNYLQGGTNGPHSGQFYGIMFGLGNDYGTSTGTAGHYASQMYYPRASQGGSPYLYFRDMESGSWGSWRKVYAGYADNADLLDGSQGSYYDHRAYTSTGNYLGGHYVSGGSEKPNSSALGAGKLKPIMLSGSNVGVSGSWNDVLWMSTYTGGDVKRSTAIISSKYDGTSVWVNKADYDSSTWGTSYLFWNSGNDGSGSGLDADTVDGVQASNIAQLNANQIFTSNTIKYFQVDRGGYCGSLDTANLQAYSTSNNSAYMSFHKSGHYAVNMGLDADNVLRIGGWSASANRWVLDMSGNMTAAGNVTAYSDIRLKENIKVIPNALEKVQKIRGVTFTRNDQEDKEKLHTGVIAQEVQDVLPEVISEDNLGIKNVAYGNMVGLLIEAIKELKAEVDDLKAQLKEK